jgi:hypothetical protein
MRIVSGNVTGNDLSLACDWSEGTLELKGTVISDKMRGKFQAKRRNDPEPYRGAFELGRS